MRNSDTVVTVPVPDPHAVIADERERSAGELVDIARLHCLWLRGLESRLIEIGLDYEARRLRVARVALSLAADACLTDTAKIDARELDRP